MLGRGVDLETAVAVKDLALRMGNAAVYKEGGIAGEDYPNHLKLKDVDDVRLCCVYCDDYDVLASYVQGGTRVDFVADQGGGEGSILRALKTDTHLQKHFRFDDIPSSKKIASPHRPPHRAA